MNANLKQILLTTNGFNIALNSLILQLSKLNKIYVSKQPGYSRKENR